MNVRESTKKSVKNAYKVFCEEQVAKKKEASQPKKEEKKQKKAEMKPAKEARRKVWQANFHGIPSYFDESGFRVWDKKQCALHMGLPPNYVSPMRSSKDTHWKVGRKTFKPCACMTGGSMACSCTVNGLPDQKLVGEELDF
jgi:hypothetical protein